MTGLDDDPSINSASEEMQCDDTVSAAKLEDVENGSLFLTPEGSSSSETETASPKEQDERNGVQLQSLSSAESNGAVSDADEGMDETTSVDSCVRMEDDSSVDGISSDNCIDDWKMADEASGIGFHADFVIFDDIYALNPVVVFSDSCVEVKGFAVNSYRGDFSIQFKIDDIISIESLFVGMRQAAMVKIRVISKPAETESNDSISGIKELRFAVSDFHWYEKREAIESLNNRYNALWNVIIDTEMDEYGDMQFPPSYYPNFKPFEEFIYPEGDSDAVAISKRDVDLLEPDTFVNDTIIDFYIKYLKDQIKPEKKHRYHFFNSFFFRKLGDLEKYPSSTFDGRAAFLRVRKWTRKVNLFEKDFVFIPVNSNYHWSLLVLCHLGEVATFKDEDVGKLAKVPCILHMDSIRGTHVELERRIQSYLWEEWKERHKEASEDISSKFSNLRFFSLELPQQQNSYDCGLFLLHYVELFLEEDPASINPFKISPLTKFLNTDWFRVAEPSLKRRTIQKLIHDLLENHSPESSPVSESNKCLSSNSLKTENATEIISESFPPSKDCNETPVCSQAEKGIEMTLFPASSLRGSHCTNNSGVSVRELFEPGPAAGSLLDMQYQPFDRTSSFNEFRSAMASMQEDVETCGNFVYPTSNENGFQSIEGSTTEACDYPCPSRDYRAEVSWNQEMSIRQTSCENLDSSPVTSICNSDNSLEVQVDGKCEVPREISLNDKLDETRNTSAENNESLMDCFASGPSEMLAVAGSDCSNQCRDQNNNSDSPKACSKNISEFLNHGNSVDQKRGTLCDDVDDSASDSDVQRAAKKLRLTSPSERHTKSLTEDLRL